MTLDEQYQKTIDDQRTHLMKLQEDFNAVCDTAKKEAEEELKKLPEEDKEGREGVLQHQKELLDEALHKLKMEVDHSTRGTMKELENIITQKEVSLLKEIEDQINSL